MFLYLYEVKLILSDIETVNENLLIVFAYIPNFHIYNEVCFLFLIVHMGPRFLFFRHSALEMLVTILRRCSWL